MKWKIFPFVLLVISCEYKPKDVYYVDLNTQPYGNIAIDLLNQPDTIILIQTTDFGYDIAIKEGQVIHSTEIRVDDELISSTNNAKGTFSLLPSDFQTGNHRLKIEVTTTSGTGSFADIAGAETLYYKREWVLITDHTPPESLEITSISEFNGRIRIDWTKNNNRNFQYYLVYRTLYNPVDFSSNETGLARICDSDTNWFVDDSYVGGLVTYHIENTGMNVTAPGIPKSYNGPYPTFLPTIKTTGDKLTFIWSKTRYPGNFGKYEVSDRDKINYTFTTLFLTENPDDTSYTHTLIFGDTMDIWLNTVPQKVNHWYPETMSDRISVYAGEKVPRHYAGLIHSNDPDIIYLVDYYSISRYNLKTGAAEGSIETGYNDWEHNNICISPDGNYLVRVSGKVAYLLDPVSLATIKSIDLSDFFSSSNPLRSNSVSNNGWLSVSMDYWPYVGGLVDLSTNDTVFTMKGYNHITIYPSLNGKYMFIATGIKSALYRYDGALTKLYDLGSDVYQLNSVNEEEIYRFTPTSDNSISILNCSDFQIVKTYKSGTGLGYYDIDPVTGLIMIQGQSDIYILDIDQKKVVNTKNISKYIGWQRMAFFNSTLFSGFGYKLYLNQ